MFNESLETLWFSKESYLPGSDSPLHSHKYFHYIFVVSGTAEIKVGDVSYIAGANEIYLTPPETSHSIELLDDKGISVIELKFFIKDSDLLKTFIPLKGIYRFDSNEVKNLLLKIIDEGLRKELHYRNMVDLKIHELLIHILRIKENTTGSKNEKTPLFNEDTDLHESMDEGIKKAIIYMHDNFSKQLSLEKIASAGNVSKFHFCRYFKKLKGTSPIQYIIRLRIEKAKELMLHSDLNITQISQMTGFDNLHYFSRYFRQKEGLSPQQFIKKYRKNMYFIVTDDSSKLIPDGK